jgi:hypothetical protein
LGQWCRNCNPYLFPFEFEYFPLQKAPLVDLHYTAVPDTAKPYQEAAKQAQDYMYLHNGNDWQGVENIFTSNVQPGAGLFKQFDFGTFATLLFEIKGDNSTGRYGGVEWTGELGFVKLFKRKQIGPKPYETVDTPVELD